MGSLKRQIDAIEEKTISIESYFTNLHKAGFARLEEKISAMESQQHELSRHQAACAGTVKGVTDEMQTLIKRIDTNEGRFSSVQHRIRDDVGQSVESLAQNHRQIIAGIRSDISTQSERLNRLELELGRLPRVHDGIHQSHVDIWKRLNSMEDRHSEDVAAFFLEAPRPSVSPG